MECEWHHPCKTLKGTTGSADVVAIYLERAKTLPAKTEREYLRGLVVGKKLGVRRITKDRYGRTMADVFLGTTNVQQEMVASGHREPLGSTPINFFGQKIGKGTKALPLVKADLMTHIALRE